MSVLILIKHFLWQIPIIWLARRDIFNRIYQFCWQSDFIVSNSRNAVSNTIGFNIGDEGDIYICDRGSCLRCVYGVHARSEFSDSHGRKASYDRERESQGKGQAASAIFNIRSALYIAARRRMLLMQNNRMSMSGNRRMYNIDHRLLPDLISLNITWESSFPSRQEICHVPRM